MIKNKKEYYINHKLIYEKSIEDIAMNNEYINELVKYIKENIDMSIKNIYFSIQNDEIIIRNIDNIHTKRKKEIIPLIKYEINKYMPIDLQNYAIEYKKIMDFMGKELIQGILFPKKFVYICKEISEKLKIKKKYLYSNFDILQKLIDINLINLHDVKDKTSVVIESRNEDIILNTVFNNKIIESYIVSKNNEIMIKNIFDENTYYFGISDDYINNLHIKKINIKNNIIINEDANENVILDYLCALGMII